MNPVVSPVYLLRAYAWAVLKANMPEVWNEELYKGEGDEFGLVPIVPLAEEPELDEFDGPHIVYGYSLSATGDLHARKSGSMTFAIYDQNFRRLTETLNILEAAFERQDESARDVNKYTTAQGAKFLGIRFGYISVGFTEGGTPEDTEGGEQSALLNIRFEYYVDYDVITDVS